MQIFLNMLPWLVPLVGWGIGMLVFWKSDLCKGYNKAQRRHSLFRQLSFLAIIELFPLVESKLKDVTYIRLYNGELPLAFLLALAIMVATMILMFVLGRVIFGKEGRLRRRKDV